MAPASLISCKGGYRALVSLKVAVSKRSWSITDCSLLSFAVTCAMVILAFLVSTRTSGYRKVRETFTKVDIFLTFLQALCLEAFEADVGQQIGVLLRDRD